MLHVVQVEQELWRVALPTARRHSPRTNRPLCSFSAQHLAGIRRTVRVPDTARWRMSHPEQCRSRVTPRCARAADVKPQRSAGNAVAAEPRAIRAVRLIRHSVQCRQWRVPAAAWLRGLSTWRVAATDTGSRHQRLYCAGRQLSRGSGADAAAGWHATPGEVRSGILCRRTAVSCWLPGRGAARPSGGWLELDVCRAGSRRPRARRR